MIIDMGKHLTYILIGTYLIIIFYVIKYLSKNILKPFD